MPMPFSRKPATAHPPTDGHARSSSRSPRLIPQSFPISTALSSLTLMHIFAPNHVGACYPPSSALLAAAPDYRPNSQELSRLTYYVANHPGKIHKVGNDLEKRVKANCTKATAGNSRARAYVVIYGLACVRLSIPPRSLLITLAILRTLAVECRRDISLLSPPLVSCLRITLDYMSSDLDVCARAASVVRTTLGIGHRMLKLCQFTAWCTYTDGHVIGVDAAVTQNYLVVIKHFSAQSNTERKSLDPQLRNRLVLRVSDQPLMATFD